MNEAPHCWKNYREISGECRSCTYAEACRLCAATEARMRRPLGGQEFDSVANWAEELADCDHIPGVEPVPARETAKTAAAPSPAPARPPRKLSFKENRELEGMEEAVTAAEAKIAEIEGFFGDPDFFEKYGSRSAELQRELDAARAEAARLYQRWEELENKRATLEGK